jgi:branched-chain amino acid transport system substrate-binding protein
MCETKRIGTISKFIGTAIVSFMLTGTVQANEGVTEKEIVIGNVLPMSGPPAILGKAAHYGSLVAAMEANEKGGINGRQIRIVTEDDRYIPSQSYQSLKKLLSDGVLGLIGTGGNANLAAMLPVIEENNLPTIVNFSPSTAAVEPIRKNIFMIGANYNSLIYSQLKYIAENRKGGTYAIIRQDDDFGLQVEAGFARAAKDFNLKTVDPVRFKRGQKDFGAEILKLRAQKIDVLVAGGVVTETVGMLKEASKFKMKLDIATVPTSTLPVVVKLNKNYGYTYNSSDYVAPLGTKETQNFETLAAKYLKPEEVAGLNRYTVTAYVATRVMIEAANRCGQNVTRACVVEQLNSGSEFDTNGITPPVKFSNTDHVSATAVRVLAIDAANNKISQVTEFAKY